MMTLQETYERQLLGRIISDKDQFLQNADLISEDLFANYADIYDAYYDLYSSDRHPSFAKMVSILPGRKGDLAAMVREVDHGVPVESIISELEEQKRLRLVEEGITRALSSNNSEDKVKVLTDTITGLYRTERSQFVEGFAAARDALKMMEKKQVVETPTGFPYLDSLTGGLHKGDLVIIAAETSQGKTSLALNVTQNVIDAGGSVAFISLEMTQRQIMERMICSKSGVAKSAIMDNLERAQRAASEFSTLKFYIADVTNNSASHIMGLIRSASIRYNVDVVVVDYLQLVSDKNHRSREQEIGQTARSLKNIAKELNINVIALSQLNRAGKGHSSYPTLSRLRDSGQVEEAADLVLFVYRPEYYGIMEDGDGNSTEGVAEIIIAKGRNYGTGKFKTHFEKDITRFGDPVLRDRHGYVESITADEEDPPF
jgi:replicative DNA helicase